MTRRQTLKLISLLITVTVLAIGAYYASRTPQSAQSAKPTNVAISSDALTSIELVPIKGRAPKTNYTRLQFGNGWASDNGCDTRELILRRDLTNASIRNGCEVESGTLNDPYTGKVIQFTRGVSTSSQVQIDHVVPLSNAWQTGAQLLTGSTRIAFANDPLELLAVDGPTNEQKSDGDATTWLPPHTAYRCQYVSRQIAIKMKYHLWMTQAEHDSIKAILSNCSDQKLPTS